MTLGLGVFLVLHLLLAMTVVGETLSGNVLQIYAGALLISLDLYTYLWWWFGHEETKELEAKIERIEERWRIDIERRRKEVQHWQEVVQRLEQKEKEIGRWQEVVERLEQPSDEDR